MKSKKGKWIIVGLMIAVIAVGLFFAKGYYNDRYIESDVYYTQIPSDEKNDVTEWIKNDKGENAEKGKEYELIGYNDKGEEREVDFFKKGETKDYFLPGIYIKCSVSKTMVIGITVVNENEVPKKALEKIKEKGTKRQ